VFTVRRERKGKDSLHITSFLELQEYKPNAADYLLSLITKLTSVSGDCVVGNQDVNINWNKVGISVLTQFLKQAAF